MELELITRLTSLAEFLYDNVSNNSNIRNGLIAGAVGLLVTSVYRYNATLNGIPRMMGLPFVGCYQFFNDRFNFVQRGLKRFGDKFMFSFGQHRVFVLTGEKVRKAFIDHNTLDVSQAFAALTGGGTDHERVADVNWIRKRVIMILRKERLVKTLPLMLEHLNRDITSWGSSGRFDPFDNIANMVWRITLLQICFREIAENEASVQRIIKVFREVEESSTFLGLTFPSFAKGPGKKKRDGTIQLYMMFKKVYDDRISGKSAGADDTPQLLIDEGDDFAYIVHFIFGALFAGITNTAIQCTWLIIFLAANRTWKEKVIEELKANLAKYANPSTGKEDSITQQLALIPSNVWEEEMPILDNCIDETIRIALSGTFLRKNIENGDVVLDGNRIPSGAFVAIPGSSFHLNADIYPEPEKFDPSRFDRGEHKKETYAFLGWGAGRHPCPGMRFAMLEMRVICAVILLQFDISLEDESGNTLHNPPDLNRDNLYRTVPVKSTFVRYTRKI